MLELNVFNMEAFLDIVNECKGDIYVLLKGKRENINSQYDVQTYLRRRHEVNKDYSRLILEIANPKDYMSIVSYNLGNF